MTALQYGLAVMWFKQLLSSLYDLRDFFTREGQGRIVPVERELRAFLFCVLSVFLYLYIFLPY